MPPAPIRVAADALDDFSRRLLTADGVDTTHAARMAEVFVWANLRGVDSHGVARLPRYLELFASGEANRTPNMVVSRPRPAVALIDADHAPGAVAMGQAVDLAIAIARDEGAAWVQVRHTVHAGAVGAYAEAAARAGMVGLVMLAGMPNMAWPGVQGAAVATSPIAIGVPAAGGAPFLLDMATAMIALGKIKQYEMRGEPLPEGSAVTADGEPTTDAAQAKMPLPLGGIKGAGLSLAFELATSVLAGSPIVAPVHAKAPGARRHRQNAAVVVVDPACFGPADAFATAVANTLAAIRGLPPLREGSAMGVPGDRGAATAAKRRTGGIPLPAKLVEELDALAAAAGLLPLTRLG
jgi:ureidoglycolate dehydrogenase (NAD+)